LFLGTTLARCSSTTAIKKDGATLELEMERHDSGPDETWRPEPLTRRNADGEVYERQPAVEWQIAEAVRLDAARLMARAKVADQAAPEYLKEECLVYLIRHYHRAGERRLVGDLSEALLRRCAKKIESHLTKLGPGAVEEGYRDAVEQLFTPILDLKSDRGDFLQVRFWVVLERLAVGAFKDQLAAHKQQQATVPLSSVAGQDRDEGDQVQRRLRPGDGAELVSPSGEVAVIENDLIRRAIERIDEPFRFAWVLRHLFEWPIESKDPSVRTISGHFRKEPRTIQNWLTKAEAALDEWRGEQQ
jgi:hypothetical protein